MSMKREEILDRLGFTIPYEKRKRVIVHTDLKNEADDQYALIHHLLSPSEEVIGVIAGHFEWFPRLAEECAAKGETGRFGDDVQRMLSRRGNTMEMSYKEGEKVLSVAEMDDIPLFRGSRYELGATSNFPKSDGADFIIREAMKEDARPLYVCFLGAITDLAIAYLKEPRIAHRLTAVWIGGGAYPEGEPEFNLCQDILAANIVFESDIPFWQIPADVYRTMEVSFSELAWKVAPCGKIGKYLFEQLVETSRTIMGVDKTLLPETWVLGDSPTISVLMERGASYFNEVAAPYVQKDATYAQGKRRERVIRVYRSVNVPLVFSDLFAKLALCYLNR